MARRKGGGNSPRNHLHAYLKSQELHRTIHRITKGFEEDSSDDEILNRLELAQDLLNQIKELLK